jgi:SAM-dependent methyltransferase
MEVPHSRDNAVKFFETYTTGNQALKGKRVIDLSAGSGYIANLFHEAGADVQLYDLFPEQNKFCPLSCRHIDLQKPFPITDKSVDIVILAETIEHLPNQFFFFVETARILKPGATLLLTTPNSSSLRSRFSQFLMESEHYSTPAPNELNAFTHWPGSKEGYFSKLFISGILRLRTLAALNGLSIKKVHPTKGSTTSYFLLICYPILYYYSRKNYNKQVRADGRNAPVYREIFDLNTSFEILVSRHLVVEFQRG